MSPVTCGLLLCPRLWTSPYSQLPVPPCSVGCLSPWAVEEAGSEWERLAVVTPLVSELRFDLSQPKDPEPLSPLNSQGRYDEEIEVYRHHLEQMYKLCRPCQAAVEHYIKHQNRQLRALLLSHQFKRREVDQSHAQVCAGARGAFGASQPLSLCRKPRLRGPGPSDWGAALQS